jgi:hypothetical protein
MALTAVFMVTKSTVAAMIRKMPRRSCAGGGARCEGAGRRGTREESADSVGYAELAAGGRPGSSQPGRRVIAANRHPGLDVELQEVVVPEMPELRGDPLQFVPERLELRGHLVARE